MSNSYLTSKERIQELSQRLQISGVCDLKKNKEFKKSRSNYATLHKLLGEKGLKNLANKDKETIEYTVSILFLKEITFDFEIDEKNGILLNLDEWFKLHSDDMEKKLKESESLNCKNGTSSFPSPIYILEKRYSGTDVSNTSSILNRLKNLNSSERTDLTGSLSEVIKDTFDDISTLENMSAYYESCYLTKFETPTISSDGSLDSKENNFNGLEICFTPNTSTYPQKF